MIITLTANPSLDRTATLDRPLARGEVHRISGVTVEAGGKGVNVARCIHAAGHPVRAVLPAASHDPMLQELDAIGLPYATVPVTGRVRINTTLSEADGTTTKLNEPGPTLDATNSAELAALLAREAEAADWVVLSGSLPPGVPTTWYADLVGLLRPLGVKVAVDTSDQPLLSLAEAFPDAAPDLLKPNSDEVAQLTGADGPALERAAKEGDLAAVVEAARELVNRGVRTVMATLGAAGAVLVDSQGAWHAAPPPITPKSTVGAGDSSVAGYVLADTRGASVEDRLRTAVAYGSAAASLAGTTLPTPDQVDTAAVAITPLA